MYLACSFLTCSQLTGEKKNMINLLNLINLQDFFQSKDYRSFMASRVQVKLNHAIKIHF
jgi:hypothetical protein